MKASMSALAGTLRHINMSTRTAIVVLVAVASFWIGFCPVTLLALPESAEAVMYFDRLLFPGIGVVSAVVVAWINLRPKLGEWARS